MDSLPEQRIEALPGATRKAAYEKIQAVCLLRNRRDYSEHDIAKEAGFGSVEAMYHQLKTWGLPGFLPPEKQEATPKKRVAGTKPERKARNLGPAKELPGAGNAAELFKERLEELLKSVELLEHADESLHGRYFVRQDVEKAAVLVPRGLLSKERRKALSEQYDLDPTTSTSSTQTLSLNSQVELRCRQRKLKQSL